MAIGTQFLDLPDEIVQAIVALLPVEPLLTTSSACRRLHRIATQPLIWRQLCKTQYRYWEPRHDIKRRLAAPLAETDWKQLIVTRTAQDSFAKRTLDGIITTQVKRVAKTLEIVDYGYDVKDFLLREHRNAATCEDILARRFWIEEVLSGIEKAAALREWTKLRDGEEVPLERALGAFDLFTLQIAPENLDEISIHLDAIAHEFTQLHPEFDSHTTRTKAHEVAAFLLSRNLTGLRSDATYTELQNTLISVALCDPDHPSIPLVSVAIFCCIAQRLGLDAQPWGGTNHVLAIVTADTGKTLDDRDQEETESPQPDRMFLDPFRSANQVPSQNIRAALAAHGINPPVQAAHMQPSSTAEMVQRMARNLQYYVRDASPYKPVLAEMDPFLQQIQHFANDQRQELDGMKTVINSYRAKYAASWVFLTFSLGRPHNNVLAIHEALSSLISNFERHTIEFDVRLIQRHVIPVLGREPGSGGLQSFVDNLKAEDDRQVTPQRRTDSGADKVRYSVGQTFQHARYSYHAAIIGWDTACLAGERWIKQMRVDDLPGGRGQCFYHAIADDESIRYVAEENIELDTPTSRGARPSSSNGPLDALEHVSGRWFKRWGDEAGKYVSNVEEQYPDD